MSDKDEANIIVKDKEEWKVEDSFLRWTQHSFFQNPWNILGISTISVVAGAYIGYKKPASKLQNLVGVKADAVEIDGVKVDAETLAARRQLGVQMAARALRIATFGTVSTFGVIGAVGFYASGYRSLDELLTDTRAWTIQNRQSFEDWLGNEDRPTKTDPEVVATKNMTEEEEMNYLYERYFKEDVEKKPDDSS